MVDRVAGDVAFAAMALEWEIATVALKEMIWVRARCAGVTGLQRFGRAFTGFGF